MEENNNNDKAGIDQKPRENLITTAVKFLQNPTVQKSSLAHRQAFLKRKGLTDEEVQIACERAGAFQSPHNEGQLQTMLQSPAVPVSSYPQYVVPPPTLWTRTRQILNTVAIIGGISYGLYLLYKKYVEPYLFGIERKQKSIEDTLSEANDTLKKVHAELERISEQQRQQSEQTAKQHQFPAATPNTLVPPSIPAWQLSSPQATDGDEGQKGEGDIEICTSGSGSSENEVVINTGSDSSLEMIRE
ncbi:hypothetical protein C0J52_15331 [Blattella germanica]|nr:hypothetical protein C0J52_15331 [Blattella germanica]